MAVSWPLVPLREIIRLTLDPQPVEVEREYPNLGIYNFGRGAFPKPPIQGCSTSARTLYRVRAGQFIYSRLFAFEGAYTVVPETHDNVFVSNEFPTFDIDLARLHPGYLRWLFRRPATWATLASEATGMGDRRQRIHPEQVLAHRIALPSVSEQRRIAALLDASAERVEAHRRAAAAIGVELDATLASAFRQVTAGARHTRLGDVAPLFRREIAIDAEMTYQEIGARAFGRGLFRKPDVTGSDLTWQKLFRIEEGDLVFSNIKAWEGAFAVAGPEHHGKMGSHRYLTCVPDPARATTQFLWFCLQSPDGLHQVQAASPGSADRNRTLRTSALVRIQIPLPSLSAQRWFDAVSERARAVRNRMKAAEDDLALLLPSLMDRAFNSEAEPGLVIRNPIAAQ